MSLLDMRTMVLCNVPMDIVRVWFIAIHINLFVADQSSMCLALVAPRRVGFAFLDLWGRLGVLSLLPGPWIAKGPHRQMEAFLDYWFFSNLVISPCRQEPCQP